MKKLISLFFAVFVIFSFQGCGVVSPDQGEEAVLIDKPMFFGHGGIQEDPVRIGINRTLTKPLLVTFVQPLRNTE